MKGKNLILVGFLALVVGFLMLFFRSALASGGIVIAAGILFVGAGVLNMTVFLGSRDRAGRARMGAFGTVFGWVASAAAVILGLAMLIFSKDFVALIGFMFAVLLLFAALFQMVLLLFGSHPARLSKWFFFVPTALVAAAVYIFMREPDAAGERMVILITGIALAVFGLFTIIEGSIVGKVNHSTLKAAKANGTSSSNTDRPAVAESHNGSEASAKEEHRLDSDGKTLTTDEKSDFTDK